MMLAELASPTRSRLTYEYRRAAYVRRRDSESSIRVSGICRELGCENQCEYSWRSGHKAYCRERESNWLHYALGRDVANRRIDECCVTDCPLPRRYASTYCNEHERYQQSCTIPGCWSACMIGSNYCKYHNDGQLLQNRAPGMYDLASTVPRKASFVRTTTTIERRSHNTRRCASSRCTNNTPRDEKYCFRHGCLVTHCKHRRYTKHGYESDWCKDRKWPLPGSSVPCLTSSQTLVSTGLVARGVRRQSDILMPVRSTSALSTCAQGLCRIPPPSARAMEMSSVWTMRLTRLDALWDTASRML